MNILFVSQERCKEENVRDFFSEINLEIEYMNFKEYSRNLNKIDFITFDFIFIEILGTEKRKLNYIKKCQEQNIAFFVNVIYIFDHINLDKLVKDIRLENFDYILKPLESSHILEKISSYSSKKTNFAFDDFKMIVKGKLLRPLEHQWKQPLNLIATNLLNLEVKSELSKLTKDDVNLANEKIEFALNKISTTLSNLNNCFKDSESKTTFSIKNSYDKVLEFVAPQTVKHNISLNQKDYEDDVLVSNYENEFSLNILMFLYVFIQWIIEEHENKENICIEFSYEQGESETNILLTFNEQLPLYEIINKFCFEFLVIKELLKRVGLSYQSFLNEENTQIKLTLC